MAQIEGAVMTRKIFAYVFVLFTMITGCANAEILAEPGIAVAETENGKLQGFIRRKELPAG